jgi:hypothetical protein
MAFGNSSRQKQIRKLLDLLPLAFVGRDAAR